EVRSIGGKAGERRAIEQHAWRAESRHRTWRHVDDHHLETMPIEQRAAIAAEYWLRSAVLRHLDAFTGARIRTDHHLGAAGFGRHRRHELPVRRKVGGSVARLHAGHWVSRGCALPEQRQILILPRYAEEEADRERAAVGQPLQRPALARQLT